MTLADQIAALAQRVAQEVKRRGMPAGGTAGQVLTKSGVADFTAAWGDAAAGGGGGLTMTRASATYTTAPLASGASESGIVPMGLGYRLYKVQTDVPARVRLYDSIAHRETDSARLIGVDPIGNHGLTLEYVTSVDVLASGLSPIVDGAVLDTTGLASNAVPISITNLNGAAAPVTVTLTFAKME